MKNILKKFVLLATFMIAGSAVADEFNYEEAIEKGIPIPFRKLTYNMGMYNAEQIDKMLRNSENIITNLFDTDNVIIGKYAYGDDKEFVILRDKSAELSPEKNPSKDQHGNVAVGYAATNLTNHSTAVGKWALTGLFDSTAVGFRSKALSHHSTAIDGWVEEPGMFNTAIRSSIGSGMYNVAIGTAHAGGDGIPANNGAGTVVTPLNETQYCVVIGPGSRVAPGVKCGVAIGHDCIVTKDNQVIVGKVDVTDLKARVQAIEAQLAPGDENSAAHRIATLETQMAAIQDAAEALMSSLNGEAMGSGKRDAEPMTLEKFLQVIIDTKKVK